MDDPPIDRTHPAPLNEPLQNTKKVRRTRGRRVDASRVSASLDEIVERLGLDQVYPLHRHVAELSGMHPTTVLRYHNSNLHTASERLVTVVDDLLRRVRDGEDLPIDRPKRRRDLPTIRTRGRRVSASLIRDRVDSLQHLLDKDEAQFLYRHIAQHTGLHPSSVRRYHRGELRTAPSTLLAVLDDLLARLESGEIVAFLRSPEGSAMVDRSHTLEVLQTLLKYSEDQPKVKFFQGLDERLGFKRGTINRIYYDRKIRFVRAEVHAALEQLSRHTEYDPCKVFEVGERIQHHLFGEGVVTKKVHKNKILVEFAEDQQVILAEAVPSDPFLRYRRAS